ncbi:hypothetical protein NFI96_003203 [Prochilodus magdalenae]|nr:hypothetical protein NFI96_003203 [Prochilodus magdalenae]
MGSPSVIKNKQLYYEQIPDMSPQTVKIATLHNTFSLKKHGLKGTMEAYGNDSWDLSSIDIEIMHHYLPIMYGIIFLVGLIGNLMAIIVYLVKLRPWKSSSIIMVNLVVADLLYALSLPFLVQFYTTMNWTLGEFMCRFLRFCFHFNLYGSILFLTCLSIFRYIVVVHPLKAAQVQRKRWGISACLAVWAISLVEIGPMLTMITTQANGNTTACLDFASNDPEVVWWYGWLLTVVGYFLPLVVVLWCYCHIGNALGKSLSARRPSRMRTHKLTVMILVVLIACFLPYHILRVLRVASRRSATMSCLQRRIINAAYMLSRPLAGLNTLFNLALYTLAGDKFQQAFSSLVSRRKTSSSSKMAFQKNGKKLPSQSCRLVSSSHNPKTSSQTLEIHFEAIMPSMRVPETCKISKCDRGSQSWQSCEMLPGVLTHTAEKKREMDLR